VKTLSPFESREFGELLHDMMPCGVMVLNSDREIVWVNGAVERAIGLDRGAAVGKRQGELFRCSTAIREDRVCCESEDCENCDAREIASTVFSDHEVVRRRAKFTLSAHSRLEEVELTLTAAPFVYDDEEFALVLVADVDKLKAIRRSSGDNDICFMDGRDPKMVELFDTIDEVAQLAIPVLIQGESGTGKELVANQLHMSSRRSQKLMVPVNCGALPEGLLESELFGHVKGAFTSAIRDKKGRFELADGGTLFLDEVGELSPRLQVKFLRVLQNGSFMRVGGEKQITVDVRLICATNKDLAEEVAAGRFRADLYYRLCVFPITVPPLRERPDDIMVLARRFLKESEDRPGGPVARLSSATVETFQKHPWPGNVRELNNAIRFASIKSRGGTIEPEHLPPAVLRGAKAILAENGARRRKLDADCVAEALRITRGNKAQAARELGVGRATLYRYLSEQGVL